MYDSSIPAARSHTEFSSSLPVTCVQFSHSDNSCLFFLLILHTSRYPQPSQDIACSVLPYPKSSLACLAALSHSRNVKLVSLPWGEKKWVTPSFTFPHRQFHSAQTCHQNCLDFLPSPRLASLSLASACQYLPTYSSFSSIPRRLDLRDTRKCVNDSLL